MLQSFSSLTPADIPAAKTAADLAFHILTIAATPDAAKAITEMQVLLDKIAKENAEGRAQAKEAAEKLRLATDAFMTRKVAIEKEQQEQINKLAAREADVEARERAVTANEELVQKQARALDAKEKDHRKRSAVLQAALKSATL